MYQQNVADPENRSEHPPTIEPDASRRWLRWKWPVWFDVKQFRLSHVFSSSRRDVEIKTFVRATERAGFNKLAFAKLVKHVLALDFLKSKPRNQVLPVNSIGVSNVNEHFFIAFVQFVTLWTRIFKLGFKIFVLQFNLAILAQKHHVLLNQRRIILLERSDLLTKQNSLLVKKVNHVFGQPGSLRETNKIFDGISGAHN